MEDYVPARVGVFCTPILVHSDKNQGMIFRISPTFFDNQDSRYSQVNDTNELEIVTGLFSLHWYASNSTLVHVLHVK